MQNRNFGRNIVQSVWGKTEITFCLGEKITNINYGPSVPYAKGTYSFAFYLPYVICLWDGIRKEQWQSTLAEMSQPVALMMTNSAKGLYSSQLTSRAMTAMNLTFTNVISTKWFFGVKNDQKLLWIHLFVCRKLTYFGPLIVIQLGIILLQKHENIKNF